ncbi:hypothetical protein QQS21_004019 [Conoideocrella luteorostrata]|uniref:Uncharacterized protein n=1 Tax=Conoideocrella luteorostrata TaxID=1105319 RepID=A0AAJ0CSB9_9HYPO|nr:hypothetical protein QQS21_004019 [Conoideocrella luteorostrata]
MDLPAQSNAPVDKCDKCGETFPYKSLLPCDKCLVTVCLQCQCEVSGRFHSNLQDCLKFPNNHAVGPPTPINPGDTLVFSPRTGLESPMMQPFFKLAAQGWLYDRPIEDVYKLLIDSYRLHADDLYFSENSMPAGSIYAGAQDSRLDFNNFLCLLDNRPPLLPGWWDDDRHQECIELGMMQGQFHDLRVQLTQAMVIDHYQDASFPTQLRLFAENAIGRPTRWTSCKDLYPTILWMEHEQGGTMAFNWNLYNRDIVTQHWKGRPPMSGQYGSLST